MTRPPPRSPLFPYTTLFRSADEDPVEDLQRALDPSADQQQGDTDQERADADEVDGLDVRGPGDASRKQIEDGTGRDRKSTRLNSSHSQISYAVFCLKKKKTY